VRRARARDVNKLSNRNQADTSKSCTAAAIRRDGKVKKSENKMKKNDKQ